jgi:DNA-binding PadR family transcriptional regulator
MLMSLAHAALTLVRDGERHAYEITSMLSHLVPGPPYNHGHIHGIMEQLEGRGHVTSRYVLEGRNRKRLYRITPRGRQALARWRVRPLPRPRLLRDEVLLKAVILGLDDPQQLRSILEAYRKTLREQLEKFDRTMLDPAACESRSELLMTLGDLLGCLRQQADLRWVERCLEELRRMDDMPPLDNPPEDITPNQDSPAFRFTPNDPMARRASPAARREAPSPRRTLEPPRRHG